MSWSFDIPAAPTDEPVWLATKCGKVIKSNWLEGTRFGPARWNGLAPKETPVAWHPFLVPAHPGILPQLDHAATLAVDHLWLADAGGGA